MKRKISQENKKRFDNLAEIGCIICARPPQIHHLIGVGFSGMGLKADDKYTIPLCVEHHDDLHRHGHKTWEAKHGTTQLEYLELTNGMLDLMEMIS